MGQEIAANTEMLKRIQDFCGLESNMITSTIPEDDTPETEASSPAPVNEVEPDAEFKSVANTTVGPVLSSPPAFGGARTIAWTLYPLVVAMVLGTFFQR